MSKPRNKNYEQGKHYRIVFFYARPYTPTFATKQEAENWIQAKGLTSKSIHFTELWEMSNETDGERLAVLENSQLELVDK